MGKSFENKVASRKTITLKRNIWMKLSFILTLFLPDSFLMSFGFKTKVEVQAWREKVSIIILTFLLSIIFLIFCEALPQIQCNGSALYTPDLVQASRLNIIHGKVIKLNSDSSNTQLQEFIKNNPGRDISGTFPKWYVLARPPGDSKYPISSINKCIKDINEADRWLENILSSSAYDLNNFQLTSCPITGNSTSELSGAPCFFDQNSYDIVKKNTIGDLYYDLTNLSKYFKSYVIINDKVYNSMYLLDNGPLFNKEVMDLIQSKNNQDITSDLNRIDKDKIITPCMDLLFYNGKILPSVNAGIHSQCHWWIFPLVLLGFPMLTFLLRLIFGSLYSPKSSELKTPPSCILLMTCYNETKHELAQSINSLIDTQYIDHGKVLMVIADGPQCYDSLLEILNYQGPTPKLKTYQSIGQGNKAMSRAQVFSGYYYHLSHGVPYLIIIKRGADGESPLPGNRGKRDSMMLVLNFLDGLTSVDNSLTPLEDEMLNQFQNLELDYKSFEYMLCVDGDVSIAPNALTEMVTFMSNNLEYMAVGGKLQFKATGSWFLDPLQSFYSYINIHLKQSFNTMLGKLTHLRSGIVLYRLRQSSGDLCLMDYKLLSYIINKRVITLHTRHMVLLGEEQYLNTLLLCYWPSMKLGYLSSAIGTTVGYSTFSQWLVRERSNFNTRFHNVVELMTSSAIWSSSIITFIIMCYELLATLLKPIFLLYLYTMIIRSIISSSFPILLIPVIALTCIVLAIICGIFTMNTNLIFGSILYVIFGFPIFHIILPLYSIFTMDNLHWFDLGGDQIRSRPHGAMDGGNFTPSKSRYTYNPYEKNSYSFGDTSPSIPNHMPMPSLYREIDSMGVPINFPSETSSVMSKNVIYPMQEMKNSSPLNPNTLEKRINGLEKVQTSPLGRSSMPVSPTSQKHSSSEIGPISPITPTSPLTNSEKSRGASWQYHPNSSKKEQSDIDKPVGIAKNFPLPPSTESPSELDEPIINTVDRNSVASSRLSAYFHTPPRGNRDSFPSRYSDSSFHGSLNRSSVHTPIHSARLPPFAPRDPKMISVVGSDYSSEYSLSNKSLRFYDTRFEDSPQSLTRMSDKDGVDSQSIPQTQSQPGSIVHPPTGQQSISNGAEEAAIYTSQQMILEEIEYFLADADLHAITRREVRAHLLAVFGDNIEYYHDFVDACVEEVTLQRLAQTEEWSDTRLSDTGYTIGGRDSQVL